MRAVIAPSPTLPSVTVVATAISQTEIDLVAIYPGIPFVVTYNFEYSDNGTTWIAIPPQKGSTYADTTLAPSQTRSYRVRVKLDGTRITGYSSVKSATTNPSTGGVTPPSNTPVKWHPGQWTESDTVLGTTGTLAQIKSEIDAIAPFPNIVGHMILVYWGFLQQQANTYTTTELDNIIAYVKSKGKRWALQVVAGVFNYGTNPPTSASNSPVPAYINSGNTSQWGTAGTRANGVTTVLSGQSGWWGGDGNGHTYGAALWRPNVMAEWIKLHQFLGGKYDSDPSCEMIHQGEDSFYQGTGSQNNSDYNDTTQRNNWENWLQQVCGAWPTTNVSFSETFLFTTGSSTILTNYITDTGKPYPNHPPLMAQTDALGAVQRSAIHTWGSQTYAGLLGTLGDRRPLGRFISEIQAPDIGFFKNLGSPREDIKAGLDVMGCTHAFWAIVPSPTALASSGTPPKPIPAKYPCTFTANVTGSSGTLTTPWPLSSGSYDMVTTAGGRMTVTKGSKSASFSVSQTQTSPTISILHPLIPFNWSNGGTSTPAQNGTSASYTEAGLLAWLNDPANALANSAYPADYPHPSS